MVKNPRTRLIDNPHLAGYIFIAPWLAGFLFFILLPMIASLVLAFSQYDLLSPPRWIGIANFKRMAASDGLFLRSLSVTFIYVLTAVPLRLVFALMIAMVLNRRRRLIAVYRTLYYLPSLFGGSVAISLVWRMLFGPNNPLNALLRAHGIREVILLGRPDTALATLIALAVWQFGSSMLIFLAGLKNISHSYYEAAVIDGAGFWAKFFRITLPLLSPIIFFNLVMQMISGFIVFTQAFVITDGGPMNSTLLYALYMFRRAFTYFDMGYASAMAWVLLLIIAFFTALLFRSSRIWVYYESKKN